jgi:hypothetical protein
MVYRGEIITHLKISGEVDAFDFLTMKNVLDSLQYIDLSDARIVTIGDREPTFFDDYSASDVLIENAFYFEEKDSGKTSLISIKLPYSLKEIESNAFRGCVNLKSFVMPPQVTRMGDKTFMNCTSLEEVDLSRSLRFIAHSAFENCVNLKTVKIRFPVYAIGYESFKDCKSLKELKLPFSLKIIDSFAFEGCDSIRSLNIPASVRTIERYAFCDVKADISIDKYNNNYSLHDDVMYNKNRTKILYCLCRKKGDYVVPDMVKEIGYEAFTSCEKITSVTIHPEVSEIDECAFSGYFSEIIISDKNEYYEVRKNNNIFDKRENSIMECEKDGARGHFHIFL